MTMTETETVTGALVSSESKTITTHTVVLTGPLQDRLFRSTVGPALDCVAKEVTVTITGTANTFERLVIELKGYATRYPDSQHFTATFDSYCKEDPSLNLIEHDAPRFALKAIRDALPPYILDGQFGSDNWDDMNAPIRTKWGIVGEGYTVILDGAEVEIVRDEDTDVADPEVDAARESMRRGGPLEFLYYRKFTFADGTTAVHRSDVPVLVKRENR